MDKPQAACTEDWGPAFRLLFQYLPPAEREHRCANALHLLQRGELNPQGLFILPGPRGVEGALLCLPIPGCTALIWPPGTTEDQRCEREDVLLLHAADWLRQRGVKLVQTLLAPEESFLAASLLRNGFTNVTRLWYMRHDLNLPINSLNAAARLHFQTYDGGALFRQTLLRTYEGTLDCPEVNGIRTVEEVLEGHRAQGVFDPQRWWLVRAGSEPVGVLLLTEMPESGDWEVAYMGVVAQARRHGYGREMLLQALCEARAAEAPAVTLSVDARNQPARNLYHALGFERYDWRIVYLSFFV